MPEYLKSKIYEIVCNITGLKYIGSTTKPLTVRLYQHEERYRAFLKGINKKRYTVFEVFEGGDYVINLIEDYPCDSRKELNAREGYYQKNLNCVNIRIEGRTPKEYYNDNIDRINARKKELYQENRVERLAQMKIYTEAHKNEKREYDKLRYEKLKDKLREKVQCECGLEVSKSSLNSHKKSKKHNNIIACQRIN